MEDENTSTIGVDLGGTKIEVAQVNISGQVLRRKRLPTRVNEGPAAIQSEIAETVLELQKQADTMPIGIGIGVAGQVDPVSGVVHFAMNLGWRDVPIRDVLSEALRLPVFVTNDVRAATWGEWVHGAGQGCDDLICLFVGTGIGGGVVSGGHLLTGCSNTAGELGHIVVDLHGPLCNCGNRGCMEALAGGWAIARSAREAVENNPSAGSVLLQEAGGNPERISAATVARAVRKGDPLALKLIESATEALVSGAVGLINAFNPCRLILGGGVIEGLPELVDRIDRGVRQRALAAASAPLRILPSQLGNQAVAIGAAIMAMRELTVKDPD
ncbi:MAG TPA: ROK family protein [Geobacteraceae bacterium]|nr:ROK family protein [Geobacteraceae bacterium]